MDYYCFPTRTGDVSVFFDLEQYTNSRERFFYQTTQEDVMLAKQKGKLLLFDLRTQTFVDYNGNAIDISGKEIFPRCKIQEAEQLLNAIANNSGNFIVTRTDSTVVENWFEYIDVQRKFLREAPHLNTFLGHHKYRLYFLNLYVAYLSFILIFTYHNGY